MIYRIVLRLILFLSIIFLGVSAQSKYDIFPLSKNLKYLYSFYQQFDQRSLAYSVELNSDSGTVEYVIRDSIRSGDSLFIWQIEQLRNLVHKKYFSDGLYGYVLDTTYSVVDTIIFSLFEYLMDNHELKCSSQIWNFPLSTFPSPLDLDSNTSAYRYSDSSQVIYVRLDQHGASWEDSTWFSAEGGMYQRITNARLGYMDPLYYTLDVKSIGKPTEVERDNIKQLSQFTLSQNYPNPFNPSTTIRFGLPRTGNVVLKVYDVIGREVVTLVNDRLSAGNYSYVWNAGNLSSGIYLCRITATSVNEGKKQVFEGVKKLLLLK